MLSKEKRWRAIEKHYRAEVPFLINWLYANTSELGIQS